MCTLPPPPTESADLLAPSEGDRPRYISRPDRGLVKLYGQPDPSEPCRHAKFDWYHAKTDRLVPGRCNRLTCLSCTRSLVVRRSDAIAMAEPGWMLRLSLVPEPWAVARRAVNRVFELLRCKGDFAAVWSVEQNPSGAGQHVHAFAHGDDFEDRLPGVVERVSLGSDFHVQPVTHFGGFAYMMKEARHNRSSLERHLHANGHRVPHATRGFWREGSGGQPLTLRSAVRLVSPDRSRDGEWRVVRRSRSIAESAT